MSLYRFSPMSAVVQARFRYASGRAPVALLSARDGLGPDQLSVIRRAMEAHGWQCVPAAVDGQEILQVTGFKEEGELAALLVTHRYADANPIITPEAGDHPTQNISEWLQHTSLKAAGWLNLIGDAGLLASGISSGREKEVTAGILYTGGAAVLARYGNVKTEHQVKQVLERTTDFMRQQAVTLPENSGLFSIARNKRNDLITSSENFLYRYPSEVMLSAYTFGAFTMLQSGLKQGNPWGVAYGANSVALKAASLIIPEKKKIDGVIEEHQDRGPVGAVIHWIHEKPLRLFGFGSMVSDALLGLSAYREFKSDPKQRSYIFKFITTGTYIMADVLLALSNKNATNADGKFNPDEQRRIVAMTAETIARQPEAIRDGLVHQVSGFLATQLEMRGNAADINRAITEQMQHLQRNPWAHQVSAAALATQPLR